MIRTRFAPSPTGYLHIGGVRTALFNWLLSRGASGQFILRIDDTDAERNKPEALQPILDGFRWLGINWDEGPEIGGPYAPYFQSQRNHFYAEAALKLVDEGYAYPCYRTKEELDAERKIASDAKTQYAHRGEHRQTSPAECRRLYTTTPTTLRLKIPDGRTIAINDAIRGRVEWQSDLIGDPVIVRSNGLPLYNFTSVVDDVAMAITHVIRSAEHLSNTAIQAVIFEGLAAALPVFAHVPTVNAPNSKEKLSKRKLKQFMTPEVIAKLRSVHAVPADWSDDQIRENESLNPATTAFYRELGYLPASLVNYFGRLGWSLDDKTEFIPLTDMIAHFSLERVNNSPASFDPGKLSWLAGEYMRLLPLPDKVTGVIPIMRRAGLIGGAVDEALRRKITLAVEACGDRLKLFTDILQYASFLFQDPVYDPKAVVKRLHAPGAKELLQAVADDLKAAPSFEAPVLEARLKALCETRGVKIGDLNHVIRVATTGTTIGPGVFECLGVLGREETLKRIKHALTL